MAARAKARQTEKASNRNRANANNLQVQKKEEQAARAQDSSTEQASPGLQVWTKADSQKASSTTNRNTTPTVQASLTVGKVDDPFEREADKQADAFTKNTGAPVPASAESSTPAAQTKPVDAGSKAKTPPVQAKKPNLIQRVMRKAVIPGIQRKLGALPEVQLMGEEGGQMSESTASKIKSTSGGAALPPDTRNQMEGHFGADFSGVKIHTDSSAVQMSQDLGAKAFTHGSNIYFNEGQYNPGSQSGDHLIAHELTHTVQQGAAVQMSPLVNRDSSGEVRRGFWDDPLGTIGGAISDAAEWVGDSLSAGVDWVKEQIADMAAAMPGYSLFTVVIGQDPITGRNVERNGYNFINAGLDIIPNGADYKQKLEEDGGMAEAAAWLDEQMLLLDFSVGDILRDFGRFLDGLSMSDITSPGAALNRGINVFRPYVNRVITFAGNVARKLLEIVKEIAINALLEWVRDQTPWYPLITVVLGEDPITGEAVERNGMNILRGFISLHPEGEAQLAQMEESGSLQKAADWVDSAIIRVTSIISGLRNGFTTMWETFSITNLLHPIDTFTQIYNLFSQPVSELVSFALEVAMMILKFIKDALIARLIEFARTIPGYHLLTVIMGKDVFSQEVVERSPENIIRGFMSLVPGGEEKFQQLKESGAIAETVAWIEGAIAELNLTWDMIRGLFTTAWNSFSLADLASPIQTFQRVMNLFGPPLYRIVRFVGKVVMKIVEIALRIMGFPFELIGSIINNARSAYDLITNDPIGFLKNLLGAVKLAFQQFFGNILTHLLNGVGQWLFGQLEGTGITMPPDFSFQSILNLVFQILGITREAIFAKIREKVGPERWARIERTIDTLTGVWTFVNDVITRGPIAIWEKIQEQLSNLWDMVLSAARNWIVTRIVEQVTIKLLSMLDPTGIMAVVNSFIAFFKAVQSAIEYMIPILEMVNSFLGGIVQIAQGNIKPAADFLEQTMARGMPIMIGFLANQVGLGRIGDKIREIVENIRERVDQGIQWLIDRAWAMGANLLEMAGNAVGAVTGAIRNWWQARKEFNMPDGEHHAMYFQQSGNNTQLMINSTPQTLEQFLTAKRRDFAGDDAKLEIIDNAEAEYTNLRTITRNNVTTGADAAVVTSALERISRYIMQLGGVDLRNLPGTFTQTPMGYGHTRVEKLTTRNATGGSAPTANPAWWQFITSKGLQAASDKWVRMHMLPERIGGSGADANNLLPAPNSVNRGAQVGSFERAMYQLAERTNGQPNRANVVWMEIQGQSPHAKDTSVSGYTQDWFFSNIKMRGGVHFYNGSDWQVDATTRVSEDVPSPAPNFTLTSGPSLGSPSRTRLRGLDATTYTDSVVTHMKNEWRQSNNTPYSAVKGSGANTFETRMRNYLQATLSPTGYSNSWTGIWVNVINQSDAYVSNGSVSLN